MSSRDQRCFTVVNTLSSVETGSSCCFSRVRTDKSVSPSLTLLLAFAGRCYRVVKGFGGGFRRLPSFCHQRVLGTITLKTVRSGTSVVVVPGHRTASGTFSLPTKAHFRTKRGLFCSLGRGDCMVPAMVQSTCALFEGRGHVFATPITISKDRGLPLFSPSGRVGTPLRRN